MKTLILAALLLIAATAQTQTPADFAEKFVIYIGGSIIVERETPETNTTSLAVQAPSHYDQDLLVARMRAHLVEHPAARYKKTWRLNTDGNFESYIIYRTTIMLFEFNPQKKVLYVVWQESFSSINSKAGPQLAGTVK